MYASSSNSILIKNKFDEILFANVGTLQIAIPTLRKLDEQPIFSVKVAIPHRIYDSEGWLLQHGQIVAPLKNLRVEQVNNPTLPFPAIKRIGPAIPLHFEVNTMEPLPVEVAYLAAFSCQFQEDLRPYLTIFRHMSPQFCRVYPFTGVDELPSSAADIREQEKRFVKQNREQLQKVPFYRERFHL